MSLSFLLPLNKVPLPSFTGRPFRFALLLLALIKIEGVQCSHPPLVSVSFHFYIIPFTLHNTRVYLAWAHGCHCDGISLCVLYITSSSCWTGKKWKQFFFVVIVSNNSCITNIVPHLIEFLVMASPFVSLSYKNKQKQRLFRYIVIGIAIAIAVYIAIAQCIHLFKNVLGVLIKFHSIYHWNHCITTLNIIIILHTYI